MKHLLLSFVFLLPGIPVYSQNQGVSIGTTTPHSSAALEIADTSKGILIPRMTMSQRLAIQNPAEGLMVYQTDSISSIYLMNNNAWKIISGISANSIQETTYELKLFSTLPLLEGVHIVPANESWKIVSIQSLPGFGSLQDTGYYLSCLAGSPGWNNQICYYSVPNYSILIFSINNGIEFRGTFSGNQKIETPYPYPGCSSCPSKALFNYNYSTNYGLSLPYWLNSGDQMSVGKNLRIQVERYH